MTCKRDALGGDLPDWGGVLPLGSGASRRGGVDLGPAFWVL
jgi:hypothetical protein